MRTLFARLQHRGMASGQNAGRQATGPDRGPSLHPRSSVLAKAGPPAAAAAAIAGGLPTRAWPWVNRHYNTHITHGAALSPCVSLAS